MFPIKKSISTLGSTLRRRGFLRYFLLPALTAVMLMCIVRSLFITQIAVEADLPQTGLIAGDRVLINRTAYGFHTPFPELFGRHCWGQCDPERGDLVAFRPSDGSERIFIEHVKAVPGDTITRPSRGILPELTYLAGDSLVVHGQIIGRVTLVTYSVAPDAPFYRCLRANRFFMHL